MEFCIQTHKNAWTSSALIFSVLAWRGKSLQKGICGLWTPPREEQAKRSAVGGEQFPSLFPTTILQCQERHEVWVVEGLQGSEWLAFPWAVEMVPGSSLPTAFLQHQLWEKVTELTATVSSTVGGQKISCCSCFSFSLKTYKEDEDPLVEQGWAWVNKVWITSS